MKVLSIITVAGILFSLSAPAFSATRVFYDGFESGTTDKWQKSGYHDYCTVHQSAADNVKGPYSGNYMVRCNSNGTAHWSSSERYESITIKSIPITNEVFFRFRIRPDKNHDRGTGSSKKIWRIFGNNGSNDNFWVLYQQSPGLAHNMGNQGSFVSTYWGEKNGDNSASSDQWNTIELYIRYNPGKVRVWHNGVLVRDQSPGNFVSPWGENGDVHITSNFEDEHDAVNFLYFDEIEVFSDDQSGDAAAGAMIEASIQAATTGMAALVPFGRSGNLTMQTPEIMILDLLGKQVQTGMNNQNQLGSGIYHIVTMEKGKRTVRRKIILPE